MHDACLLRYDADNPGIHAGILSEHMFFYRNDMDYRTAFRI